MHRGLASHLENKLWLVNIWSIYGKPYRFYPMTYVTIFLVLRPFLCKIENRMKTILHIMIGISIGILIVTCGVWLITRVPQGESVTLSPPPTPAFIQVIVTGAVVHPGLYELEENSCIADAVYAAGGYTEEADNLVLNLAARLENTQILEVPYKAGIVPKAKNEIVTIPEVISSPFDENEKTNNNSNVLEERSILPDVAPITTEAGKSSPSCTDRLIEAGAFVWPADNHFLSGNDYSSGHTGIDIAAGEGSPVYAVASGTVMAMGNDSLGYGNVIQIDHGNGYYTVYAHLSKIGVSMGQCVHAGQQIGSAGNTGNSQGTHLHFEVIRDGWYINPWLILP